MFHNSQDINYRRPFGAVSLLTKVTLKLDDAWAISCDVVIWEENKKTETIAMNKGSDGFTAVIEMPDHPCIKWYYFVSHYAHDGIKYYGNNDRFLGGIGCEKESIPLPFQITVYKKTKTPDWYKEAIVYQIFPDRFCKGADFEENLKKFNLQNKDHKGQDAFIEQDWDKRPYYIKNEKGEVTAWPFYGGTLGGIIEKLDYLKSLNVSALYLNPIFKARSNHRYDTADYMNIDPLLGNNESFELLAKEAKARGISIILDGVFNHTGADSIYFDIYKNYENKALKDSTGNSPNASEYEDNDKACSGAYHHEDSIYRSWYRFNDECECGYESWWGVKDLPDINELNESYVRFITGEDGVIKHWLKLGASGFRLDVADELPDEFIKKIRTTLKNESEDDLLIGEVWEDASNKRAYGELREYFLGDELDAVMNYPLRDMLLEFFLGKISAYDMAERMDSIRENYPGEAFYGGFNLIGSHDRARSLTVMSDDSNYVLKGFDKDEDPQFCDMPDDEYNILSAGLYELAKYRMKSMTLLQFALPGVPVIYYGDEAGMLGIEDPYNRAAYPWGKEDQDLLSHYRALTKSYKEHLAFISGGFFQKALDNDTYMLGRFNEKELIIVVTNRNINEPKSFEMDIRAILREVDKILYETAGQKLCAGSYENPYKAVDLFTDDTIRINNDMLYIDLSPIGSRAFLIELK